MMSRAQIRRAVAATLALLPIAGCGGGGGGGSAPASMTPAPAPAPPPYMPTAEDNGTPQLSLIKATGAFGRGYFGSGVTVAVFDTGLFAGHSELAGRATTGYDAFSNGGTTTDDWNGHGTAVAGVIAASRNGTAPEGVAPQSTILPVRVADKDGTLTVTDAAEAAAIAFVQNRGIRVVNYSLNDPVNTVTSLGPTAASMVSAAMPSTLPAWQSYVAAGGVVVVAAGNESKAEPGLFGELPLLFSQLSGGWLVVGSVDSTGKLSSFSNKCGIAAAFCLVAPGEGVLSLGKTTATALVTGSGTSFTAPEVAAALAVVMSSSPTLTAKQAAQILLQTANKTGIYADSATYGQGLLDLDKATQPIGTMSVTAGTQSFTAQSTSMTLGSAFGAGLQREVAGVTLMGQDSFGRGFLIPLDQRLRAPAENFMVLERLAAFGRADWIAGERGAIYRFGETSGDGRPAHVSGSPYWFEAQLPVGGDVRMAVSFNSGPAAGFGPMATTRSALDRDLLKPFVISDPYVGLIDGAAQAAVAVPSPLGLMTMSFAVGAPYDPTRSFDIVTHIPTTRPAGRVVATKVSFDMAIARRATLQWGLGALSEERSLLGAVGTGAAQCGNSNTAYASLAGRLALSPRFDLAASFHVGVTHARGAEASLIGEISHAVTTAMGVGVAGHDLFRDGDRLAFGVSQPLRVVSGDAQLALPFGFDANGFVARRDVVAGLKADGREVDLQGSYGLRVSARTDIAAGVLVRNEPGNLSDAPTDVVGVFRVAYRL